jgi:hypothetical protein
LSTGVLDFFFAILVWLILSFDISPLDMLSPLWAAGPVVGGALSGVCANAADESSATEAAGGN